MFSKTWYAAGTALAASLLVLGATPAPADPVSTLPVTMTARPEYRLGEPVEVTFALHNPTGQDRSLLVWDTPLERRNREVGRYVTVRQGNRDLKYEGRVVKRMAVPDAASYRTVRAGETVRETVDLSTAFAFTEPGRYTATLDAVSATFELLPGGQPRPTVAAKLRQANPRSALGPKFRNMSDSQEREVRKAIPKADRYVEKALDALNDDPRGSHYKKWFGKWDDDRYKLVKSHYRKIDHDADDTTYDGDCHEPGVYAYVYPDNPDHMWLCNAFWDAPTTGDDSKAGTIVHEQSHFTVNGGTEDLAYGHAACKKLAEDHPGKAVMNADSHEYFAETLD